MRLPPTEDQINDWSESVVTQYLKYLIDKELELYERTDVFFRSEPQKTQEALLEMIAEVSVYQRVKEALEGDFSELGNTDEDEE
jgi:hypothetical protein